MLTTTPLGPSVTPTSAWSAVAAARAARKADTNSDNLRNNPVIMKRLLLRGLMLSLVVASVAPAHAAQGPAEPPRPKVLAFFTVGGELDHLLFAQQAMRALGASAADKGYTFAATS